MNIEKVAVIGTGMMGPGIAAVIALAGFDVTLIGKRTDRVEDGVKKAHAVQLFADKVKQGDLGVKTGKGFYDWNTKSIDDLKQLRDDFIIQTLHFRAKHKSG